MKRARPCLFAVIALLFLLSFLVGCGDDSDSSGGDDNKGNSPDDYQTDDDDAIDDDIVQDDDDDIADDDDVIEDDDDMVGDDDVPDDDTDDDDDFLDDDDSFDDTIEQFAPGVEWIAGGQPGAGGLSMVMRPSGNIYIAATKARFLFLYRYKPDGTVDVDYVTKSAWEPKLAMDATAGKYILFTDIYDGSLKLATKTVGVWDIETVTTDYMELGFGYSIVVDGNGFVHIVYYRDTDKTLIHRTNETGSWADSTITTVTMFEGIDLAVDSNNTIHMAVAQGELFHYLCAQGVWTSEMIDIDAALFPSIAIDRDDSVHIAYMVAYIEMVPFPFSQKGMPWEFPVPGNMLRYCNNEGGEWLIRHVEDTGLWTAGLATDIAVDNQNVPHFGYAIYYAAFVAVKYSHLNDYAFPVALLDIDAQSPQVAADASGTPWMAFYSNYAGKLSLRTKIATGLWGDREVDPDSKAGNRSTLALMPDDTPCVAYADVARREVVQSCRINGIWQEELIGSYGGVVPYVAHRIDSSGASHIAYHDGTTLFYVTDASGQWTAETVYVGKFTDVDLELDANNEPRLLFFDHAGPLVESLTLADRGSGEWVYETVFDDAANNTGKNVDLAIDSIGNNHVVFTTVLNSSTIYLYFGTDESAAWQTEFVHSFSYNSIVETPVSLHIDEADNVRFTSAKNGVLLWEQQGGTWNYEIAGNRGMYGKAPFVVDTDGYVHGFVAQQGLYYFGNESGQWSETTLDTVGLINKTVTMAQDSTGLFHIAYLGDGALWYTTFDPDSVK